MLMLNLVATTILTSATVATNAIDEVQVNFVSSEANNFDGFASIQMSARVNQYGTSTDYYTSDPNLIHVPKVQISLPKSGIEIDGCSSNYGSTFDLVTSADLYYWHEYFIANLECNITLNGGTPFRGGVYIALFKGPSFDPSMPTGGYLDVALDSPIINESVSFTFQPGQSLYWAGDCPGDVNGDGKVDVFDLAMLSANYNKSVRTGNIVQGDLNGDGIVNFADLLQYSQNYGRVCNPLGGGTPAMPQ